MDHLVDIATSSVIIVCVVTVVVLNVVSRRLERQDADRIEGLGEKYDSTSIK